jgi:hypothetical protein
MLHLRDLAEVPIGQAGKTQPITLRLHPFAPQHGKRLDKTPVSFQIFVSARREGVPGKLFAGR